MPIDNDKLKQEIDKAERRLVHLALEIAEEANGLVKSSRLGHRSHVETEAASIQMRANEIGRALGAFQALRQLAGS